MAFTFDQPTKAVFGPGKIRELHAHINEPGARVCGKKALVVISNGKSTRANGYLDTTLDELGQAGVECVVYDGVQPNPTKAQVMEAAAMARDNACDFVVGLGGGSVLDAAKIIAMMATNEGDLWDYVMFGTGGKKFAPNKALPIVCITTTAGTGSEADSGAVISNPDTCEKTLVFGNGTYAALAIVDPELMMTVPAKFKAYQGFDALFHSTEGYIAGIRNEMSKIMAQEAIRNVSKSLARTIEDPQDIDAMTDVALGQYLSGIQMESGCCISEHGLEHVMSAAHEELPHGAGLIMISRAYYQTFIDKHACDDRFVEMARLMGKHHTNDPQEFIVALVELQEACGVADLKMSDYGITPDEFEGFVASAKVTQAFLFPGDPAPLSDEDMLNIYKNSYR